MRSSTRDLSHIITVENEEKKFRIRLPNNLVAEKYDFVLLKGQLPYKSGEYCLTVDGNTTVISAVNPAISTQPKAVTAAAGIIRSKTVTFVPLSVLSISSVPPL